jgi:hypothetical protein
LKALLAVQREWRAKMMRIFYWKDKTMICITKNYWILTMERQHSTVKKWMSTRFTTKSFRACLPMLLVGLLLGISVERVYAEGDITVRAIFNAPKKEAKKGTQVTVTGWTDANKEAKKDDTPKQLRWWWTLYDARGRVVDDQNGNGAQISPFKFTPTTDGSYRVKLIVIDSLNRRGQDTEIVATAGGPTVKKPVVKPTTYHPLRGAVIYGPNRVKAGQRASWEGVPDGGLKPSHFRWRLERGAQVSVVDGTTSDISTKITRGFKGGPVTITFLVWDDKTGRSNTKMAKMVVQVEEEETTTGGTSGTGSIAGWWLWKRGTDLVPVYLNPRGSDGLFRGVYFPYLTLKTLRKTPDKSPSKLAFKALSGNTFKYAWNYPGGVKGTGEMTLAGKTMQGKWVETGSGNSGSWMWGRPDATALANLQKHFGR